MKTFFLFMALFLLSNSALAETQYGIKFSCDENNEKNLLIHQLKSQLKNYNIINITKIEYNDNSVNVFIPDDNILNNDSLKIAKTLNIIDDEIYQPILGKKIKITSKQEILTSLLLSGRLTNVPECKISTLNEHIGIRQNIVLWASNLTWVWPDGESAFWNNKYWHYGTPNNLKNTYWSLYDAFKNQDKYSIGCYTATKMVYSFAILDYYKRVNKNLKKYNKVLKYLNRDKDPLLEIEPGIMWKFEKDFNIIENSNDGKLLEIKNNINSNSIIPGDWIYILNTDEKTYQKTGYEGSNAIYLGQNKFDDYYNDNNHYYTFEEKIDEVYQWRNNVFSRIRDKDNIQKLSVEQFNKLKDIPENGGLLINTRTVPKFF